MIRDSIKFAVNFGNRFTTVGYLLFCAAVILCVAVPMALCGTDVESMIEREQHGR